MVRKPRRRVRRASSSPMPSTVVNWWRRSLSRPVRRQTCTYWRVRWSHCFAGFACFPPSLAHGAVQIFGQGVQPSKGQGQTADFFWEQFVDGACNAGELCIAPGVVLCAVQLHQKEARRCFRSHRRSVRRHRCHGEAFQARKALTSTMACPRAGWAAAWTRKPATLAKASRMASALFMLPSLAVRASGWLGWAL